MRLHQLTMTAFGPFADTHGVDFDALSAGGLFLLHGPTGAGKTSVLDAICFALYGQVPGSRSGGRLRVRSDHAPIERRPQVRLELTIGGRRLEVTRSPEWLRPRRRGTGVTTEAAATQLRELVDGQWQPVTTRNDEAAQLLLQLLGMGLEQFTKVVLLPQGEFAAFLRADAEQRRLLLGRLFDIDRFAAVEGWLADERRRLAARVEQADQATTALLARASEAFAGLPGAEQDENADGDVVQGVPSDQVTGAEPAAFPGADPDAFAGQRRAKPAQQLADLCERAGVLARAAHVGLEMCTERASAAHALLAQASQDAARRARWVQAQAGLRALDEAQPVHEQAVGRIDLARRAAPVGPLLASCRSARAAAVTARTAVQQARGAVPPPAREADEQQLRRLVGEQQMALGSLAAARARASQRDELDQRIAQTSQRLDAAGAALDRAQEGYAQACDALTRHQGAHHEAELAANDLVAATAAHVAAQRVLQQVGELAQHEARLADAERARIAAVQADQLAREHLITIRERRLGDIATELAAALVDGEPCLVCGSCQHPEPASGPTQSVGPGDEQGATTAAEATRAAREAAVQHHLVLLAARDQLVMATQGADLAEAEAVCEAAKGRVLAAERARADCSSALDAVAVATKAREQCLADQQQALAAQAQHTASLRELSQQRAALNHELAELSGADGDVLARTARLEAELEALENLLQVVGDADLAERLAKEQDEHLRAASAEYGFTDPAAAAQALLAPAELVELVAVVEQHERRRGALLELLADPDLAGVGDLAEPDLAAIRAEVLDADRALQRATSSATLADDGARRLRALATALDVHEATVGPVRERYDTVDGLASCLAGTGGGNALRMRLSAYVLAARLEEVAAAATERLEVMSDGRYALVHSDERAKGGARSGLGLRVLDAWTGIERDTSSLSGGESFLASLALALGLADVVQAEAGGAAIETLFVDEGFGSLDDDTLEEVMGVLDSLRDGGRAVGLVSHVPSLRARIPAQLEVRKTRSGSTLVAHHCHLSLGA